MSTSLLYHVFGVKGYDYVRTRYEGGEVEFTVKLKPDLAIYIRPLKVFRMLQIYGLKTEYYTKRLNILSGRVNMSLLPELASHKAGALHQMVRLLHDRASPFDDILEIFFIRKERENEVQARVQVGYFNFLSSSRPFRRVKDVVLP